MPNVTFTEVPAFSVNSNTAFQHRGLAKNLSFGLGHRRCARAIIIYL